MLPLHIFRGLRAAGHEAWLCVGSETRPELEQLLGPDASRVEYIEDARKHAFLRWMDAHSPQWLAPRYTYYYASVLSTLLRQRRIVLRLIETHHIDLVHQPTPVSPKAPSFLAGLPVPLVVGPLNGGMEYPPGFRFLEPRPTRLVRNLGRLSSVLFNRLARGKHEAALVLVANERSRKALPAGITGRIVTLVENGIDPALWLRRDGKQGPSDAVDSLRLIFIGRLERLKGTEWLIEAMAGVIRQVPCELTIVGDFKTERDRLSARARDLSVSEHVKFLGWQTQARCAELLADADALVLPSVFECGGAVVLEAMASGKAVIAAGWGGPADYLDESCGILVDPRDPKTLVAGLQDAIVTLASDRARCAAMGRAGRQKALAEYAWPVKTARLVELYRSVRDGIPAGSQTLARPMADARDDSSATRSSRI